MSRPEKYAAIQQSWSRSRGQAISDGAKSRVNQCLDLVNERDLSADDVLVIGPQHGYELQALAIAGVQRITAIDCVQSFVNDGRELGFDVHLCEAENLDVHISAEWNFYTSHALEHCYDLERAVANIVKRTLQWAFVCVPIEPNEVHDKAHFSPIRDIDTFKEMFEPLTPVWDAARWGEKGNADFRCLFVK